MREVEGERYGRAERERAKGELRGRETKKKEERDGRLGTEIRGGSPLAHQLRLNSNPIQNILNPK